jgi:hypothetical protein
MAIRLFYIVLVQGDEGTNVRYGAPAPNHNVEQLSSEGVIYTEGVQDAIMHCAIRGITYGVRLPSMGD